VRAQQVGNVKSRAFYAKSGFFFLILNDDGAESFPKKVWFSEINKLNYTSPGGNVGIFLQYILFPAKNGVKIITGDKNGLSKANR